MAQEQQEVDRFSHVNQEFADDNLTLFTTSSLLGALMPVLAAVATLIILWGTAHAVTTRAHTRQVTRTPAPAPDQQ